MTAQASALRLTHGNAALTSVPVLLGEASGPTSHDADAQREPYIRARASRKSSTFWEDSWCINAYAGELDVRPPVAPTTDPDGRRAVNASVIRLRGGVFLPSSGHGCRRPCSGRRDSPSAGSAGRHARPCLQLGVGFRHEHRVWADTSTNARTKQKATPAPAAPPSIPRTRLSVSNCAKRGDSRTLSLPAWRSQLLRTLLGLVKPSGRAFRQKWLR